MSSRAAKLVPIGVVAGAMGYFCWSHLEEQAVMPPPHVAAKAPEMTAALLSPPAAPDLDRDPFARLAGATPAETSKPERSKPATASSVLKAPDKAAPGNAAKQRPGLPLGSAHVDGLVLSGTYVRGDRRMAIINGSLYSEGEQITPAGSASVLGSIARVDVDRVVVKLDGSHAELSYWTHGSTPTDHPQQVSLTTGVPSAHQERAVVRNGREAQISNDPVVVGEPAIGPPSDVAPPASRDARDAATQPARNILEATH